MLLLFPAGRTTSSVDTPGGTISGHGSAHVSHNGNNPGHLAFAIDTAEVEPWKKELAGQGILIESELTWPTGARSLYFCDLDENLVELLTPGFWRTY